MGTSNLCVRVDENLKREAERCLGEMGMNLSTAINIYLRRIAATRTIPFSIEALPIPNAETVNAIREGDRLAHDANAVGYHDMDELVEALNS